MVLKLSGLCLNNFQTFLTIMKGLDNTILLVNFFLVFVIISTIFLETIKLALKTTPHVTLKKAVKSIVLFLKKKSLRQRAKSLSC